jgi:hypothetical protein
MSNPLKKFEKRCYESNHLHIREWGLLDVLQRVTKGCKSTLFFDGRTIAGWFSGVSKTAIYDSKDRLVREGWLIPLNGTGKKRQSGSKRFEATQYRVLDHEEWIKTHKGECKPVRNEGLESSPELGTGPVRNEGLGQSGNPKNPVRNEGRSSVIPCSVKTNSVKACSVEGPSPDSNFSTSGQHGSGEATLSTASSPELGTGCHTLQTEEPRKVDWDAIQAKVDAEERERGRSNERI